MQITSNSNEQVQQTPSASEASEEELVDEITKRLQN